MLEPLLSIIIPVYNTEKFLRSCLDSVLKQVYWNIEVIVVNDASPDNSKKIIMEYQRMDKRIRYIENAENQGLFKARLRGYEQAHGEYICTVDSDDTVGIDYYRVMMKKAVETDSDIVVSKFTIMRYDDNYNLIRSVGRTYGNFAIENIDLNGEDILEDFFKTLGKTSHRFIVWNKVYKKSLWDRAYSYLLQLDRHHIMLEDMIFGIVFMSLAQRYIYADTNAYFYAKHPAASTGKELEFKQYSKYLSDIFEAYIFIENYLKQIGRYNENAKKFLVNAKNHWRTTWVQQIKDVKYTLSAKQKEYLITALNHMHPQYKEYGDVGFFYREDTPFDDKLEKLKKLIAKGEIKVVSFDIFDTLVVRPFFTPKDLFVLMDNYFWELNNGNSTPQYFRFSEIRCAAERVARSRHTSSGFSQEVTLDEIYQTLSKNYDISKSVIIALKQREKDLELRFCTARKKIRELYEFARYCGKTIIATSDMYLDKDTVEKILEKCGYTVDHTFISSEIGVTKATGDLYHYVANTLKAPPYSILHIGDNWQCDGENAKKAGLLSWYIPSANDLFLNKVPDNNKQKSRARFSDCLHKALAKNYLAYWDAKEYFGIRCMLALTANKIFDDPYYGYTWDTDFNMNPYYVGYCALGMHNFGIAHKLLKTAVENCKSKIIFVARDGFAVKQVYDIISKHYEKAPESEYIYVSRKALFPLLFKNKQSLFTIKDFVNIGNYTIRELILMVIDLLNIDVCDISEAFAWEDLILDKKIEDENSYVVFIQKLSKYFSEEKATQFRYDMRNYFGKIVSPDSIFFDIGYSARTQVILSDLLGYNVDAFYIHKLKDTCEVFAEPRGIKIYTYFDYRPSVTGKIREVLQSDTIPSCIGYKKDENNEYKPIFEKDTHTYEGNFVMSKIFEGMRDFVRDVYTVFDGYLDKLTYSYSEISFIHEFLIHNPTGKDTNMFRQIFFEDDMLLGNTKSIQLIWWDDLRKRQLWGPPKAPDPIIIAPNNDLCERHYRVSVPEGSVLYIVTSSFNLLCMLAHKMKYNEDKTCFILLSEWRMELLDSLKNSGIFDKDKIFIFRDRYVRNSQSNKETLLLGREDMINAYYAFQIVEQELPFELRKFAEINIGNDAVILGIYLIAHGINYNYFEDAIGLYADPYLLQYSIDASFPKNEQYFCSRFGVFGRNPYAITKFINYAEQKKEFDRTGTVDFNITEIMNGLPNEKTAEILRAYNAAKIETDQKSVYNLLLTAPMIERHRLNEEQNHNLFAELTDIFLVGPQNSKLVVKPHPDDKTDYYTLFPDAIILKKTVISELLPYILDVKFSTAMSIMSTSIANIRSCIDNQILFYTEILENNNFEKIIEYYAIARIIAQLKKSEKCSSVYCAEGISMQILSVFLKQCENCTDIAIMPYDKNIVLNKEHDIICCVENADTIAFENAFMIISFVAPVEKTEVLSSVEVKIDMKYQETGWVMSKSLYLTGQFQQDNETEKVFTKEMKYSKATLSIYVQGSK